MKNYLEEKGVQVEVQEIHHDYSQIHIYNHHNLSEDGDKVLKNISLVPGTTKHTMRWFTKD